jgi:uncharacterized cupin superfamily protein
LNRTTRSQLDAAELQPDPIPGAWILAGAPQARTAELSRSRDGARVTLLWDCTAGEYLWRHAAHETMHILEGDVVIDEGLGPRTLAAGARACFRAGQVVRCRVPAYVKKLSRCRDPQPRPVRLARRALGRLKRLTAGRAGPDAGPPFEA